MSFWCVAWMARHTETPETPSGERCRAASPTSLFQPSRDQAQVPCGAHSQGTEAAAGSLSQPGAATSQLRCRDPGLTKNLLYHHATVCVFFHSSLVASTTILEVGSQLFFVSSYSYSPLMRACKYYNTHKLLVALQVQCTTHWSTAILVIVSSLWAISCTVLDRVGPTCHKQISFPHSSSSGNKDYSWAQAFYI